MFDALLLELQNQLSNEFFAGGLALGVIGAIAAWLSYNSVRIFRWLRKHMTTEVTIDSKDPLYDCVLRFLTDLIPLSRWSTVVAENCADAPGKPTVAFYPGYGRCFARVGTVLLQVEREKSDTRSGDGDNRRSFAEELTLTVPIWWRNKLYKFISEAAIRYGQKDRSKLEFVSFMSYGEWGQRKLLSKRSIGSLVLKDGLPEDILSDARWFLENKNWYEERGIPWRRGFLLHGQPGTGKSSLIRAIASELDLNIAALSLTSQYLDDRSLAEAMRDAPEKSILVFEDMDAAFGGRNASDVSNSLSFSGLLNALDGIAAQEGHLVIMTTNHPGKLDPALIRPGRIDRKFEIGLSGKSEAKRMFLKFFPDSHDLAEQFSKSFENHRVSPAALQSFFLCHAFDPSRPVDQIDDLLKGSPIEPPSDVSNTGMRLVSNSEYETNLGES